MVALYFACKKHGFLEYENDGMRESIEPFGVVYFIEGYSTLADDINVKIITALAKRDMEKENTIEEIFEYLVKEKLITDSECHWWMSEEHIDDFIKIIQENYLVMPLYSNERLIKQSGAFLLPGLFGFMRGEELLESVITKCKKDLRSEFSETYFYIDGNDKDLILEELNWYNINESTLFPELEHQLKYIKQNNCIYTKPVADFEKYSGIDTENQQKIIEGVPEKMMATYTENIKEYIFERLDCELGETVLNILLDNMVIDWYRRDNIKSKMKVEIVSKIRQSVQEPKRIAANIVKYIVDEYINMAEEL